MAFLSCNSGDEKQNEQETIVEIDNDIIVILTTFNEQQQRNVQIFEINTNKKQEIKGEQGTVIAIPANCFGKDQGKVKIELIECYSIKDMMFNNLSTQTADGKLLESEGMIYLNAISEEGDTLKIKKGKLKVQMPTEQRKEDIQIFEGVENNNCIAWNLSNEKLKNQSKITKPNENKIIIDKIENNYSSGQDSILQTQPKTGQPKVIIDKQVKNKNIANYVFNISKMGWINCDRYIEGETQELLVSVSEEQENVSFYLVLDKLNSNVIPRNSKAVNGQFGFDNIPLKESFTLVALATKGEKIYFGVSNHFGNEGTVNCPELKAVTRQELTDILLEKFGKNIWSRPLA